MSVLTQERIFQAKQNVILGRDRELNDLRTVLALPEGRRLLWRIMSECGTFRSMKDAGSAIQYYAGKQDVGVFIGSEIQSANFKAYMTMQQEAHDEQEREQNA